MPELFFPSRNLSVDTLFDLDDQESMDAFIRRNSRRGPCATLTMNSPYCLASAGPQDDQILHTLQRIPQENRDHLMCVIDDLGDLTTTIAEFYDQQLAGLDLELPRGLVGAGATASYARLTAFQRALRDYQVALNNLHNNRHGSQRVMLRQDVQRTYIILQQRYQVELKKLAHHSGKNRGNAINSAERGIRVAERRRGRHLYVSNVSEAQKLDRLARNVRFAGHGMVVLDAGVRVNGVYTTYQNGGNWMREASIEATGFGLGGAAGLATGKAVVVGSQPSDWG